MGSTYHWSRRSIWAWSTWEALLSLQKESQVNSALYNKNDKLFNSLFINYFVDVRTEEDVQLGQGYPSGLQNRAFQVALEDQQGQSFLGDLPIQTLPVK